MSDESKITQYYYINLPLDEALEIRDSLEDAIWEIARQNDVEETLREAKFDIKIGQPAVEAGVAITVVVTYLATKLVDKVTDKALDKAIDTIWSKIILPKLRRRFGKKALVEKE